MKERQVVSQLNEPIMKSTVRSFVQPAVLFFPQLHDRHIAEPACATRNSKSFAWLSRSGRLLPSCAAGCVVQPAAQPAAQRWCQLWIRRRGHYSAGCIASRTQGLQSKPHTSTSDGFIACCSLAGAGELSARLAAQFAAPLPAALTAMWRHRSDPNMTRTGRLEMSSPSAQLDTATLLRQIDRDGR